APGDFQAAVVTISQVYLQGTGGRTVLRNTPYTVDLLTLAGTSTVLLENVAVPAGTYTEMRFVVTGAYIQVEQAGGGSRIYATAPDYTGLPPGATVDGPLQLPSFATSGLKVQLPAGGLTLPAGTVGLMVDFDVTQSFGHQAGNSGMWVMHPVIRAMGVTQGTSLTVTLVLGSGVTLPAGVTLGDFRATLAAASAPGQVLATAAFSDPDGDGTFAARFGFVAPGADVVNLEVPSAVGGVTTTPAVPFAFTAVAGPATTLAFSVTRVTAGGVSFASVSAGDFQTCGLTPAGAAYCWGDNEKGQLGDGTQTNRLTPVAVKLPSGVMLTSVSVGFFHACGLTSGGAAYCWGWNELGQLGDGTIVDRLTPVAVAVPTGVSFSSLSTGRIHTCGLTPGGAAFCWGFGLSGQLGDGTGVSRLTPVAVAMPAGVTFTNMSAGDDHTCGGTSTGAAYCWGFNLYGQIGDGTTTNRLAPVAVLVPAGVAFAGVAAGSHYTCARTAAGTAYCWGDNGSGQLGDGTSGTNRLEPVAVQLPSAVTFASVAAGSAHTCGLTPAGAAYCWGQNGFGELGDGTVGLVRLTPVAVVMPSGVTFASVSTRHAHNCGLTPSGAAYCWGRNADGELGDGTTTDRLTPVAVVQP
ncbi:MAG TPA: DUF4382 domain-containing protein, partial [Steroidobacteraceae bacterium]